MEVKMNRQGLFILLFPAVVCLFATPAFSKRPAVESRWASPPVKVDAHEEDWMNARFSVHEDSKAEYAVRNDGENLYIIFLFRSPLSATTIDFTGMKIYFSAEGAMKKDLGLRFFKKEVKGPQFLAAMEKRGEVLSAEKKAEILKGRGYFLFECEVINAKKVPSPSDPAVKTAPPTFRSGSHERVLVYEFRIPLSRTNQPGGIGAVPGRSIALGFEWGGMTNAIMKDMVGLRASLGSRAGSRDAGSEAGWRDAGDPGSVRENVGFIPPSEYNRDPRYKKHSFWIDVKLAEAAPRAGDRSPLESGVK
jgi:hypothetical protein